MRAAPVLSIAAFFVALALAFAGAVVPAHAQSTEAEPADQPFEDHESGSKVDPSTLVTEKVTLPNGLIVLLAPDPRARFASVIVKYQAGTADEPDGLRGLAHMVEHVAAGHGKHATHPLRAIEAAGGCLYNAETTLDSTAYFESIPPERLGTVLWVEADRMGYAAEAVTEQAVDSERPIVANEERDRHHDGPLGAVASYSLRELVPPWHPYASSFEEPDLGHIHAKDVAAFLRTWYSPSNATLAIAGRFDRTATLEAIQRDFGTLPSTRVPARPALPAWSVPGVKLTIAAAAANDVVTLAWRTPPLGEKDDAALDLVAAVLAGRGNVRLQRTLLAKHLAVRVHARQESQRRVSFFEVQATVAPGIDERPVVVAIQQAIDDIARSVDPEEVALARDSSRALTLANLESTWTRASQLLSADAVGAQAGPGFDWGLGRYASLEPADVSHAAGTWLSPAHRVTTVVLADRRMPLRGVLEFREEGPR
jgi:zinc protease